MSLKEFFKRSPEGEFSEIWASRARRLFVAMPVSMAMLVVFGGVNHLSPSPLWNTLAQMSGVAVMVSLILFFVALVWGDRRDLD